MTDKLVDRLQLVLEDAERYEYDDSNPIWLADDGTELLTLADLRALQSQAKEIERLKPCPFPHEAKRGAFLEIDVDFGFARGSCADCGCCGPYVTLANAERASPAEKAEAVRLWNTRAAIEAMPSGWQPIETAPHACHFLATYFFDCEWSSAILMRPFAGPWTHWQPLPEPPLTSKGPEA